MTTSKLFALCVVAIVVLAACGAANRTATPAANVREAGATLGAPTADNRPTPTLCEARNIGEQRVVIYQWPSRTDAIDALAPGASRNIIAQTGFGWYVIPLSTGGRGWIAGEDIALAGPCGSLPSPTPGATATPACPSTPPTRLIIGQRGRVLDLDPRPLNLRAAPGLGNTILKQIPVGGVFFVLGGPQCADNFTWYRVRYQGTEGWSAEGDLTGYYVEPYLPG